MTSDEYANLVDRADHLRAEAKALQIDVEYACRHAFAYANCHVPKDDAKAYADYYCSLVRDEELEQHWPSHSDVFIKWRIRHEAGKVIAADQFEWAKQYD